MSSYIAGSLLPKKDLIVAVIEIDEYAATEQPRSPAILHRSRNRRIDSDLPFPGVSSLIGKIDPTLAEPGEPLHPWQRIPSAKPIVRHILRRKIALPWFRAEARPVRG
jgi:hypothetical protein